MQGKIEAEAWQAMTAEEKHAFFLTKNASDLYSVAKRIKAGRDKDTKRNLKEIARALGIAKNVLNDIKALLSINLGLSEEEKEG